LLFSTSNYGWDKFGTIAVSILSSKVDTKKDKKIDELLNGNQLLQSSNAELHGKIDKYQLDLNSTVISLH